MGIVGTVRRCPFRGQQFLLTSLLFLFGRVLNSKSRFPSVSCRDRDVERMMFHAAENVSFYLGSRGPDLETVEGSHTVRMSHPKPSAVPP